MASPLVNSLIERAVGTDAEVAGGSGSRRYSTSWLELVERAEQRSRRNVCTLTSPKVALVGTNDLNFVERLIAVLIAGESPVILPPKTSGMSDVAYGRVIDERLEASGADLFEMGQSGERVSVASSRGRSKCSSNIAQAREQSLIQFSSGTSGSPQPVVVPLSVLVQHLDSLTERLHLNSSDRLVCWMPLHHDMGLVASLLTGLRVGASYFLRSVDDFRASPLVWISDLRQFDATVTSASSFSLGYTGLRHSRLRKSDYVDGLGGVRCVLLGSEVIRQPDVDMFLGEFTPAGLDEWAICPAYGLAEATVGVCVANPGSGVQFVSLDKRTDGLPKYALLGEPLAGVEVQVCDSGAVLVRGSSVVGSTDADGWHETGDLGEIVDGQLVVLGRKDDMISLGSQVLAPTLLEAAVEQVVGVRKGAVAAVAIADHRPESAAVPPVVGIIVEASDGVTRKAVVGAIQEKIRTTVGTCRTEVRLVPRGTIPKTSSGKIQRRVLRKQLLESGPSRC